MNFHMSKVRCYKQAACERCFHSSSGFMFSKVFCSYAVRGIKKYKAFQNCEEFYFQWFNSLFSLLMEVMFYCSFLLCNPTILYTENEHLYNQGVMTV